MSAGDGQSSRRPQGCGKERRLDSAVGVEDAWVPDERGPPIEPFIGSEGLSATTGTLERATKGPNSGGSAQIVPVDLSQLGNDLVSIRQAARFGLPRRLAREGTISGPDAAVRRRCHGQASDANRRMVVSQCWSSQKWPQVVADGCSLSVSWGSQSPQLGRGVDFPSANGWASAGGQVITLPACVLAAAPANTWLTVGRELVTKSPGSDRWWLLPGTGCRMGSRRQATRWASSRPPEMRATLARPRPRAGEPAFPPADDPA